MHRVGKDALQRPAVVGKLVDDRITLASVVPNGRYQLVKRKGMMKYITVLGMIEQDFEGRRRLQSDGAPGAKDK